VAESGVLRPVVRAVSLRTKSRVLIGYGLVVATGGCLRYFTRAGGENALWFGLVMGGLAVTSGIALARGCRVVGWLGGGVALGFVGGWLAFETLVERGVAQAEARQLFVLGVSLAVAVVLALPGRAADARQPPTTRS